MILNRKSVELLAPAGNWDALVAAVEAGADVLVSGSYIFGAENPAEVIKSLKNPAF